MIAEAYVPLGEMRVAEPMSRHVSWRAGGLAERFYVPSSCDDLVDFVASRESDERLHVVGLGSNLLVRDGGLDATVVLTHGALRTLRVVHETAADVLLEVAAGVPAPKVARTAARMGLSGAEFLAGIPGTLGGALAMNAGCYGSETWDYVASVTTLDRTGRIRVRTSADYDIGYRHVVLREGDAVQRSGAEGLRPLEPFPEWFLSARLRFPRGDSATALARIRELLSLRVASQPLGQPNAGSVFRNPEGGHAAQLIESCGLKGERIGAAEVSRKHANFIVNLGGASARDIESLIHRVQETVRARTGVALVTEVRIIGNEA
jgi:UDP-N-acetylmuramate dehydrogenase